MLSHNKEHMVNL